MVNEVLVLGGGLAGGSAAARLAQANVPVHLLERETGPHDKICGEFLSIEAQADLREIGLDPARFGAVPIDRVRLVRGERMIEAALPFLALGISRKVLDEALLETAIAAGARVQRGVRVTGIGEGEAITDAGPHPAQTILLATGKLEIRGANRIAAADRGGHVGFKMHWRIPASQQAEVGSAIELVLFEGGYAGLQRVAGDVLNLCLLIRRSRLSKLGGRWEDVLDMLLREPFIARRLGDAQALFARPLTIANLPYGYVCDSDANLPSRIFRLGDQAALTAPLTGDGMAIALRSARLAAECLQAGMSAADYHKRLQATVKRQVERAMVLQGFAERPLAIGAGMGLLRLWPSLLGHMAAMTRLGHRTSP